MNLCGISDEAINYALAQPPIDALDDCPIPSNVTSDGPLPAQLFNLGLSSPEPMHEVQEQFFKDFKSHWQIYVDDPRTWNYDTGVFQALTMDLLRLAAWDFEAARECKPRRTNESLPTPTWNYPKEGIYWFHEHLIVLQDDIASQTAKNRAIERAKLYLNEFHPRKQAVRVIVISLRHIAFLHVCSDGFSSTKTMELLTSTSSEECMPGFRALAQVLTSPYGTHTRVNESWKRVIPPELLDLMICELEPRDTIAFAQASPAMERSYYRNCTVSQFNFQVKQFGSSIPCCGKKTDIPLICCSECLAWYHLTCGYAPAIVPPENYICRKCELAPTALLIRIPKGCTVQPDGCGKVFPLTPWFDWNPDQDWTILFNGECSGLEYCLARMTW
ncbi:hypothetical protein BO94DRAFT_299930 [Aspergillus sclerotioniger CBS 115572]|uniref:Zinc finger PHD-type domain-containing protein n=1 Tax=Aspergillus sclerotioniger CBS 115572 TaxID=1450535 RepID=A0A317V7Q9_9EURO|nr:hypothetical protein BO94DRAFT_299930 [Aspergillus sclerotioniger CBS 115572]PWY69007.1 hypothetical protein BO94DRAFT_299930 [Aspergillus sclerotioniger CBS 115572]